MKTKGYQHQLAGVEASHAKEFFAYFMEMGTGKSWCLLADAERAYNNHEIECLIILAPKGVYRNWLNKEIPEHLSVPHECFIWSASLTERQEKLLFDNLFRKTYKLKIFIANIEGLVTRRCCKALDRTMDYFTSMLTIDESTVIKNPAASRTKEVLKLAPKATLRRILTGSPITKSPNDLYAQSEFLKPLLSGFSSLLNYRHYYAEIREMRTNSMVMRWDAELGKKVMVPLTYEKVLAYKNLDKLNARIQPWSYRVMKKDCLDLPDKVYMTRDVELTDEQAKAYNQMFEQWCMEVEQGSVTASISLTKSLRLHQILCGHVKKDDGTVMEIPSKRVDALMDLIEEASDEKIIIACKYRNDVAVIKAALALKYGEDTIVEFHGAVSDTEREIAKKRIQEDPNCHFFLCSKAACRGITLTACTLLILFSYDYDREAWVQMEDRIHRIGMSKCTIVHLKVPFSIDETILQSHKDKGMIESEILAKTKALGKLSAQ